MPEDLPGTPPGADEGAWELPWAEPFAAGSGRPERAQLAAAFGAAIRRTGSLMQLMGQAAADRIGINATDLNCLNILSFSGQMTAGQLAKATGLTTASITGVIDRLERPAMSAGNVTPPTAAVWSSAWFWSTRSATSPRCSCRWSGPGRTWRNGTATKSCG